MQKLPPKVKERYMQKITSIDPGRIREITEVPPVDACKLVLYLVLQPALLV